MKPDIKQLEQMIAEGLEESRRVKLAISLNICPTCGSNIISQTKETLIKPIKILGIVVKSHRNWDYREVCSESATHYENKGNVFM